MLGVSVHSSIMSYRRFHLSLTRGSLQTASERLDMGRGKHVKVAVMKASQFKQPRNSTQEQWIVSILENSKYKLKRLRVAMAGKMVNGGGNL